MRETPPKTALTSDSCPGAAGASPVTTPARPPARPLARHVESRSPATSRAPRRSTARDNTDVFVAAVADLVRRGRVRRDRGNLRGPPPRLAEGIVVT